MLFLQTVIDGCVYQIHPIYDLYAAFRDGQIILLLNKSQILELNSKVLENMETKIRKDIMSINLRGNVTIASYLMVK